MVNPLPITVSEWIEGIPPRGIERTTRKTYPFGCTVLLMFLRTLVTNRTAAVSISRAVRGADLSKQFRTAIARRDLDDGGASALGVSRIIEIAYQYMPGLELADA